LNRGEKCLSHTLSFYHLTDKESLAKIAEEGLSHFSERTTEAEMEQQQRLHQWGTLMEKRLIKEKLETLHTR